MTKGLSAPLGVGRADAAPTASSRGAARSERTVREPRAGLAGRLEGRRERRPQPCFRAPAGLLGGLQAQVGAPASPYTEVLNEHRKLPPFLDIPATCQTNRKVPYR